MQSDQKLSDEFAKIISDYYIYPFKKFSISLVEDTELKKKYQALDTSQIVSFGEKPSYFGSSEVPTITIFKNGDITRSFEQVGKLNLINVKH